MWSSRNWGSCFIPPLNCMVFTERYGLSQIVGGFSSQWQSPIRGDMGNPAAPRLHGMPSPHRIELQHRVSLEGMYVAVILVRISWSPTSTDSIETNKQTLCCISKSTMKYQQRSVWKPDLPWFTYGYPTHMFVEFLFEDRGSPNHAHTVECGELIGFWRCSSISFRHVCWWRLFFDLTELHTKQILGSDWKNVTAYLKWPRGFVHDLFTDPWCIKELVSSRYLKDCRLYPKKFFIHVGPLQHPICMCITTFWNLF